MSSLGSNSGQKLCQDQSKSIKLLKNVKKTFHLYFNFLFFLRLLAQLLIICRKLEVNHLKRFQDMRICIYILNLVGTFRYMYIYVYIYI